MQSVNFIIIYFIYEHNSEYLVDVPEVECKSERTSSLSSLVLSGTHGGSIAAHNPI